MMDTDTEPKVCRTWLARALEQVLTLFQLLIALLLSGGNLLFMLRLNLGEPSD